MDRYQLSDILRSTNTPPAEDIDSSVHPLPRTLGTYRTTALVQSALRDQTRPEATRRQVEIHLPSPPQPAVVNIPADGVQESHGDIRPLPTPVSRFGAVYNLAWELELDQPPPPCFQQNYNGDPSGSAGPPENHKAATFRKYFGK